MSGRYWGFVAVAALLGGCGPSGVQTARIGTEPTGVGSLIITGSGDRPTWTIEVDLAGLGRSASIRRAHLLVRRLETPAGAPAPPAVIRPQVGGAEPCRDALKPVGAAADRFDATELVREVRRRPGAGRGIFVESLPGYDPRGTWLEIEYDGGAGSAAGP